MGVHVEIRNDTHLHAPNSSASTSPASLPKFHTRIIIIALNEYGKRIGETHQNARIPDATVDLIRERHEDDGRSYVAIAAEFSISVNTIKKICTYQRRAQTPVRWKRIRAVVPVSQS